MVRDHEVAGSTPASPTNRNVAQLVRASVWGTESRQFESAHSDQIVIYIGALDNWPVRLFWGQEIAGSSPAVPTKKVRQFLRAMTIICFGCSWHLQKGDTSR